MLKKTIALGLIMASLPLAATAQATGSDLPFAPVPTPEDVGVISLPVAAEMPALEEVWRNAGTERWATNVTQPTLLPVLPEDPAKTRAAVIVVPGGGFQFISMDNEGYPIAEWLAEQGVAAFVLKYRTMETPTDQQGFAAHMSALFAPQPGEPQVDMSQGIPLAVADAQAALALVRAKSEDWGYDDDKIGMLGFSAGAITTLGVTASPDAETPDFIGYIYGPMNVTDVPENAPPMFAALAADDGLFAGQGFALVDAWQASGAPVELHYYQSGGHGFGSYKRGVPADDWFDQFTRWMAVQDLLTPAASE